jgi:hypothetical protein
MRQKYNYLLDFPPPGFLSGHFALREGQKRVEN